MRGLKVLTLPALMLLGLGSSHNAFGIRNQDLRATSKEERGQAFCMLIPSLWAEALRPAQESSFTLEGKITEVVKDKLTVSTEDNIIFHVRVDDKTDIKRDDGSAGSAKDLHAGIRVKVAGDLEESGEIKAQKIEIEPK